jgi:hypothetical protein
MACADNTPCQSPKVRELKPCLGDEINGSTSEIVGGKLSIRHERLNRHPISIKGTQDA